MTLGMFLVPAAWSQLQQHHLQLSNHTNRRCSIFQYCYRLHTVHIQIYHCLQISLETIKDKQRLIRIGIILFFQSYNTTFTTISISGKRLGSNRNRYSP